VNEIGPTCSGGFRQPLSTGPSVNERIPVSRTYKARAFLKNYRKNSRDKIKNAKAANCKKHNTAKLQNISYLSYSYSYGTEYRARPIFVEVESGTFLR
jgi:hypothetical protein